MDITNFITWFINQFISIITQIFSILQSITFLNTNLLQVITTIIIITTLIPILLTIGNMRGKRVDIEVRQEKRRNNDK